MPFSIHATSLQKKIISFADIKFPAHLTQSACAVCLQAAPGADGDGPSGWRGGPADSRDGRQADGQWGNLHQTLTGESGAAGGAWRRVRPQLGFVWSKFVKHYWCWTLTVAAGYQWCKKKRPKRRRRKTQSKNLIKLFDFQNYSSDFTSCLWQWHF